jgi:hypothetical protein
MANRTASPAVRPVDAPVLDRIASGVVTATPPVMLAVGTWFGEMVGLAWDVVRVDPAREARMALAPQG